MQLNIGAKIRELRKRDGRTQDALAEALGVTAQAVSRWEQNGSYPDMEIIPAIANYFHISIDELFGYHDDREEKIKNILDRASEIISKQGRHLYRGCLGEDFEACVQMLRAASEEFPNEPKILLKLAQALGMWGWSQYGSQGRTGDFGIIEEDTSYNAKNIYWQEAVRAYEKLLKSNPSAEDREKAIYFLTVLYCRIGEYAKAKALANDQNTLIICKERLLSKATVGEEKVRYQGECMMELLGQLYFSISEAIALRPAVNSSEYGVNLLLSVVNVYEMIFIDGRFGKYHGEIGRLYLCLASYESERDGSLENALHYFDQAFDHYKEYIRIYHEGNYSYTAPLVSGLKPLEKGDLASLDTEHFWKDQFKLLSQSLIDEIRKNPKYAECFE